MAGYPIIFSDNGLTEAEPGDSVVSILADTNRSIPPQLDLEADIAVNGGFDSDTTWSKDTGWTIAGGVAICDGTQTVNSDITQLRAEIEEYQWAFAQVTLVARSAGAIRFKLGNGSVSDWYSEPGTYSVFMPKLANDACGIVADPDFVGSIDNFILRPSKRVHSYNPNGAERGLLGSWPVTGRRNIVTVASNDFTTWGQARTVSTKNEVVEDGSNNTHHVTFEVPPGLYQSGDPFTFAVDIAPGVGTRKVGIYFFLGIAAASRWNPETGALEFAGPAITSTTTEDLGDGWHRVSITAPYTDASQGVSCRIYPVNGTDISYQGDGTSSIKVRRAQIEQAGAPTAYQDVTASGLQITETGVENANFIRLDGVDDVVPMVFEDGFTGDVFIAGREGCWVETGVTVTAGGTLEIGPEDGPGGTLNLMLALGGEDNDFLEIIPISPGRPQSEYRAWGARNAARGGKGLLIDGPELFPAPTFASDTGLTLQDGWSVSGGQLVGDGSVSGAGNSDRAFATLDFEEGALYLWEVEIDSASGGVGSDIQIIVDNAQVAAVTSIITTPTIYRGIHTGSGLTGRNVGIGFSPVSDGDEDIAVNSFSLKKLTPTEEL